MGRGIKRERVQPENVRGRKAARGAEWLTAGAPSDLITAAACFFSPPPPLLLLQQAAGPERIDSAADANAPQPNVVETDGAQSSGPE